MESLIPATANIAFWINAKVAGKITNSDFTNACETLLGFTLPVPLARVQANSHEIALSRTQVLRQSPAQEWEVIERDNSLMAFDPSSARLALLSELEEATHLLSSMATLGSRDSIDDELSHMYSPHLPALEGKQRHALDLALRVRLVCHLAVAESQVPSSPSSQTALRTQLRTLDDLALSLICAIASNA